MGWYESNLRCTGNLDFNGSKLIPYLWSYSLIIELLYLVQWICKQYSILCIFHFVVLPEFYYEICLRLRKDHKTSQLSQYLQAAASEVNSYVKNWFSEKIYTCYMCNQRRRDVSYSVAPRTLWIGSRGLNIYLRGVVPGCYECKKKTSYLGRADLSLGHQFFNANFYDLLLIFTRPLHLLNEILAKGFLENYLLYAAKTKNGLWHTRELPLWKRRIQNEPFS